MLRLKKNDVSLAYTMSNPLPTSLELTSNQILQIAGDSVWGSANIESSVYDRVGYEMTTDRLTFTSSNPSAVTVDSNGVVTGMGRIDSSVITVTDKILGSSYSFTVRVAQRRYRDYSSDDCIGIRTYIIPSCRRNSLGMG